MVQEIEGEESMFRESQEKDTRHSPWSKIPIFCHQSQFFDLT
jgi:hypothetical protein